MAGKKASAKAEKSPYEEYTEKQVKAAFEVFDEDRNGRAKVKHLGTILRALGRVITTSELKELQEKIQDKENPKYMFLNDVLPVATSLLIRDSYKSASKDALMKAFAVIDRDGKGYIEAEYMKRLFTEYGESTKGDIVDKFISDSTSNGNTQINYKEFCEKLLAPEFFDIEENRRKIRLELNRENSRITH